LPQRSTWRVGRQNAHANPQRLNFGAAHRIVARHDIQRISSALFLRGAWTLWHRTEAEAEADGHKAEKSLFRFSLLYLFLHFAALLVEAALRSMAVTA
jgi:heme O synthase-like polyprenyltransferase